MKLISGKIDDYNSSVYYENPSYIFESYKENTLKMDNGIESGAFCCPTAFEMCGWK